jgi:hypothetical protein
MECKKLKHWSSIIVFIHLIVKCIKLELEERVGRIEGSGIVLKGLLVNV